MKPTLLGLVLVVALAGSRAAAQVQPPNVAPLPPAWAQALDVQVGSFQSLHVTPMPGGQLAVAVVMGGQPCTIELAPYDLRGPQYRLLVEGPAGLTLVEDAPAPSTWQGAIAGESGSVVAATVVDGAVKAWLRRGNGEVWVVQPIRDVVPGAPATSHAVYRGADSLPRSMQCGVTQAAVPVPASQGGEDVEYVCDIALEADYPLYQANGSNVATTQNDVLGVLNAVNTIYRNDVQIRFVASTLIVDSAPDPYTTSVANTLLTQFQQRWQSTYASVARDVAHLFTGRNVGAASSGTIGIAYLGAICNFGYGYGLTQTRWSTNFAYRVAVTAHELGHNFNAAHCDGQTGCAIMCSGAGGCTGVVTTFSAYERNQITAFRNAATCLSLQPTLPQITSATPNTWLTVNPPQITLAGSGFFGVNQVNIGSTPVTSGITVVSDTQLRFTPPVGTPLGPQLVSATNSAGTSNVALVVVNAANPCQVIVPTATYGGATLAWRMGGWPGDPAILGVSVVNSTSPFLGQQLMDGFLTLWNGVLDARGLANLSIIVPPGLLTGFTIYSQLLDIDPATNTLRSVSSLPGTWIVF